MRMIPRIKRFMTVLHTDSAEDSRNVSSNHVPATETFSNTSVLARRPRSSDLRALPPPHPQRFELLIDRALRSVDRARVVAEVVGEVGAEEERVELEGELRGIDGRIEMAFVDRHADCFFECADPVVHQTPHGVANGTGTAVEFERCGGEEASAGEDAASQIRQPG